MGSMNELKQLESIGLVLPTPAYMLGAILFGIIGYVAFRHGRKTARPILTWTGLALMLYPYAIDQTWLLFTVGMALCAAIYLKWN
jgi:predicted membrane-bound mannosyltransferase